MKTSSAHFRGVRGGLKGVTESRHVVDIRLIIGGRRIGGYGRYAYRSTQFELWLRPGMLLQSREILLMRR